MPEDKDKERTKRALGAFRVSPRRVGSISRKKEKGCSWFLKSRIARIEKKWRSVSRQIENRIISRGRARVYQPSSEFPRLASAVFFVVSTSVSRNVVHFSVFLSLR